MWINCSCCSMTYQVYKFVCVCVCFRSHEHKKYLSTTRNALIYICNLFTLSLFIRESAIRQ